MLLHTPLRNCTDAAVTSWTKLHHLSNLVGASDSVYIYPYAANLHTVEGTDATKFNIPDTPPEQTICKAEGSLPHRTFVCHVTNDRLTVTKKHVLPLVEGHQWHAQGRHSGTIIENPTCAIICSRDQGKEGKVLLRYVGELLISKSTTSLYTCYMLITIYYLYSLYRFL